MFTSPKHDIISPQKINKNNRYTYRIKVSFISSIRRLQFFDMAFYLYVIQWATQVCLPERKS